MDHTAPYGPSGATARDDLVERRTATRAQRQNLSTMPTSNVRSESVVDDSTPPNLTVAQTAIPKAGRQAPRAAQRDLKTAPDLQSQRVLGVSNWSGSRAPLICPTQRRRASLMSSWSTVLPTLPEWTGTWPCLTSGASPSGWRNARSATSGWCCQVDGQHRIRTGAAGW